MTATYALRFDSGRTSLDLLATVGGALSPSPVERLDTPERLLQWLRGTGLLPRGEEAAVDEAWLARFQELRDLVHRVVHTELGTVGRADDQDLAELNRVAGWTQPAGLAVRDADGVLRRRLAGPVTARGLMAAVADDAVRLLTGPAYAYMRECEGEDCDMVYLDTSRGRRRRWCSSTTCGNRERVARHRARRRDAGHPGAEEVAPG
jgi:predicted RNA-binding Zn ribbon-like protein